jgi:mono/diheme cytochrome c family protein
MAMCGGTCLVVAAVSTALAACSGSGAARPPPGQVVFIRACSACHTLSGPDDPRRQGGDLLNFHASPTQMTQLASEMPFRHPLSRPDVAAVVSYVIGVERRGSSR